MRREQPTIVKDLSGDLTGWSRIDRDTDFLIFRFHLGDRDIAKLHTIGSVKRAASIRLEQFIMQPRFLARPFATAAQAPSTSSVAVPPSTVHLPLTHWPRLDASTAEVTPSYVALPSHIFSAPRRLDILHQCVVTHLASLRQGTAQTKNRAQVRGSTRKIMRQKGSGKARVGDAQSPIRRGGGHAFAKTPKDWTIGLNKKVYEMGLRTALSERWRSGEVSS